MRGWNKRSYRWALRVVLASFVFGAGLSEDSVTFFGDGAVSGGVDA